MAITKYPDLGKQANPDLMPHSTSPPPSSSYGRYRELDDLELITLIREGIPAVVLKDLANNLRISSDRLCNMLKAPRPRKSQGRLLPPEITERAIGLIALVDIVRNAISGSDNMNEFDTSQWLGAWLLEPLPALGGELPGHLLDTMTGVNLVTRLLNQGIQGVYG